MNKNLKVLLSGIKFLLLVMVKHKRLALIVGEYFSLVVKLATFRTVLSLAISKNWSIHQLDVKNFSYMVL